MQNDHQEFDLLVRSVMQDAEEPVSPRVWDAVSAGLDARKRRPVFLRWHYAVAAVAAAAAVVLGVVLPVMRDNSNLPNHNHTIEIAVLPTPAPGTAVPAGDGAGESAHSGTLLADGFVRTAGEPAAVPGKATVPRAVTAPDERPADVSVPPVAPAEPSVSEDAPVPGSGTTEAAAAPAVPEEEWTDPFARMEREDAGRSRPSRISVSFGGSMESNGNPSVPGSSMPMRAPMNQERAHMVIEQTGATSSYAIPVSAGVSVRLDLGRDWGIGTGVNWTMLQRTFPGTYRENGAAPVYHSDIHNTLHYIGIPVNVYYNLLQGGRLDLYAFAGGTVEKAVMNRFRISSDTPVFHQETVDGFQYSAAAGFGVQFRLARFLGLYIDPSLRYYFDSGQPRSIRTQQPLMMNFEVGFRFNL